MRLPQNAIPFKMFQTKIIIEYRSEFNNGYIIKLHIMMIKPSPKRIKETTNRWK